MTPWTRISSAGSRALRDIGRRGERSVLSSKKRWSRQYKIPKKKTLRSHHHHKVHKPTMGIAKRKHRKKGGKNEEALRHFGNGLPRRSCDYGHRQTTPSRRGRKKKEKRDNVMALPCAGVGTQGAQYFGKLHGLCATSSDRIRNKGPKEVKGTPI